MSIIILIYLKKFRYKDKYIPLHVHKKGSSNLLKTAKFLWNTGDIYVYQKYNHFPFEKCFGLIMCQEMSFMSSLHIEIEKNQKSHITSFLGKISRIGLCVLYFSECLATVKT